MWWNARRTSKVRASTSASCSRTRTPIVSNRAPCATRRKLLGYRPVARHHERIPRLVAGRGGVLHQLDIVREDVARDCTCRILVARVLIVDPNDTRVATGTSSRRMSHRSGEAAAAESRRSRASLDGCVRPTPLRQSSADGGRSERRAVGPAIRNVTEAPAEPGRVGDMDWRRIPLPRRHSQRGGCSVPRARTETHRALRTLRSSARRQTGCPQHVARCGLGDHGIGVLLQQIPFLHQLGRRLR